MINIGIQILFIIKNYKICEIFKKIELSFRNNKTC